MNILIVDDERNILRDFISEAEQIDQVESIVPFDDPKAALAYVKNGGAVDLAFIDISMPEVNGMELLRQLRLFHPDLFITFMTAYSEYAVDAFELEANGYILKPFDRSKIEKALHKYMRSVYVPAPQHIEIRTFGRFDLFVNGTAVHFRSAKAKELLALLVDKAGGNITMDYVICYLWGNRPYDNKVKTLYRIALKNLRETLQSVGAESILLESRNSRSIDASRVSCDYFDLLNGKPNASARFNAHYMDQYSWGEETLAYLIRMTQKKTSESLW